jgi:hypothetical protein
LPRHDSDALAFTCLALFCLGLVLYLIVMTMVFLRWTFVTVARVRRAAGLGTARRRRPPTSPLTAGVAFAIVPDAVTLRIKERGWGDSTTRWR